MNWQSLKDTLQQAEAAHQRPAFWWRDDDAITQTSHLQTLFTVSQQQQTPLYLACIPALCDDSLALVVSHQNGLTRVLHHGHQHTNHATGSEKKCEYPASRSIDTVYQELISDHSLMVKRFHQHYRSVFVPPWNRMDPRFFSALDKAGFTGLSTLGQQFTEQAFLANNVLVPNVLVTNVHLDIIDWKAARFAGKENCINLLQKQIKQWQQAKANYPIGIMSHHLVHTDEHNDFLAELFECLEGYMVAPF